MQDRPRGVAWWEVVLCVIATALGAYALIRTVPVAIRERLACLAGECPTADRLRGVVALWVVLAMFAVWMARRPALRRAGLVAAYLGLLSAAVVQR